MGTHEQTDSFPTMWHIAPSKESGRLDLEIPNEIQNLDEFWRELELELDSKSAKPSTQARTEDFKLNNTPRMNVLMLVVGSRGDVQPFLALGLALKQYGHRVRIATHTCFQTLIEDQEIEFFDLGGDPKELMAYMVKNPSLVPGLDAIRSGEVRARRDLMRNIINRSWHACFEASSARSEHTVKSQHVGKRTTLKSPVPFVADSIIANPPSMGHIHCAEKLGIPLHIFFTMPWSPTAKVPHPLANVKSSSQQAGLTNLLSYFLVESVIWQGLGDIINNFRYNTLNLDPIHPSKGPLMLQYSRIPHTYCWSPSLLPQPPEWRPNVAVTGYVCLGSESSYTPPPGLQRFLDSGPPPIYVGFGSIVVENTESLNNTILKAVQATGHRLVLSTGWSDSDQSARNLMTSNQVYVLRDDCPHDWLFPRMACVVHHGGAGTTAAGLRAGRPTVVVPFFGDQFFWGDIIYQSNAGPNPIPYRAFEVTLLIAALEQAMQPETRARAEALGEQITKEDGLRRALEHFHDSLPRGLLSCCLLPTHAAVWKIKETGVLLSSLSATILRKEGLIKWSDLELYRPIEYATVGSPYEPISGAAWAVTQLLVDGFRGMGEILFGVGYFPVACHRVVQKTWSDAKARRIVAHEQDELIQKGASNKETLPERPARDRATVTGKQPKLPGGHIFGGMTRIVKAAARAPGAFTSAMAQGSHNLPHLWNDRTVRPSPKVTGFRSGVASGCKELVLGVYDGTSGLFVQPILGLIQDGPVGFVKGAAKGALGLPVKFFAAASGICGHPLKGLDLTVSQALKTNGMKAVQRERMLQGEYEYTKATHDLRTQVISEWARLDSESRK